MIHDAIRDEDGKFLEEVLTALSKRYEQAAGVKEYFKKCIQKTCTTETDTNTEEGNNNENDVRGTQDEKKALPTASKEKDNKITITIQESSGKSEENYVEDSEKRKKIEEDEKEKNRQSESLAANLQELENAHVHFARNTKGATISEDLEKKLVALKDRIDDMKDRIGDLKNEVITGDTKTESHLWDAPNENGETPIFVTTSLDKAVLTNMLLDCNPNVNIQNTEGDNATTTRGHIL